MDFSNVNACPQIRVHVTATNVRSGAAKIFSRGAVTADAVLASACLPQMYAAVEIDGEAYWDGGFSGNPALFPLFYQAHCDDILLVQINPIQRRELPTKAREIQDRLNEITFNASMLRELRAIDFVNRLIDDGKLPREEYKRVLMHRIDGGPPLAELTSSSRMNAEWSFLLKLRDMGRTAGKRWLKRNYEAIGKTGTLDLREAIG